MNRYDFGWHKKDYIKCATISEFFTYWKPNEPCTWWYPGVRDIFGEDDTPPKECIHGLCREHNIPPYEYDVTENYMTAFCDLLSIYKCKIKFNPVNDKNIELIISTSDDKHAVQYGDNIGTCAMNALYDLISNKKIIKKERV
jgi:hypothetical protein